MTENLARTVFDGNATVTAEQYAMIHRDRPFCTLNDDGVSVPIDGDREQGESDGVVTETSEKIHVVHAEQCGYEEFARPEWERLGFAIKRGEYDAMCTDIDALSYDLPSQQLMRRISSVMKKPDTVPEKQILSERHKQQLVALTANTGSQSEPWPVEGGCDADMEHIAEDITTLSAVLARALASDDLAERLALYNTICRSIRNVEPAQAEAVVNTIEHQVAQVVRGTRIVDLPLLDFLGRLREAPHALVHPELVKAIERCGWRSTRKFEDQLAVLLRMKDENANLSMHHVLSYLREHLEQMQNRIEEEMDAEIFREHQAKWHERGADPYDEWEIDAEAERAGADFSVRMVDIFEQQVEHCPNYLLSLHTQDYVEMLRLVNSKKPDAISGTAGGASDTNIFIYRHILDAYRNRLALGMIHGGYPAKSPVFEVARGYLAEFNGGRMSRVFDAKDVSGSVDTIEQVCIARNDSAYEYIYEHLAIDHFDERYRDDSYKLNALQDLWDFYDQLKADKASFFFDLSKVEVESLHPMVLTELVTRNQMYLAEHSKNIPELASVTECPPIAHEEYMHRLSPTRDLSPREEYLYGFTAELGIRKKIEADFGLDLGELSLWEQRRFMEVLIHADAHQARYLQEYVRTLGTDGIKALVAGEVSAGNTLFDLYEECEPRARKEVFEWYGRVVDRCYDVRDYICQEFGCSALPEHAEHAQETASALLFRATGVLEDLASGLSSAEDQDAYVRKQVTLLRQADVETSLYGVGLRVMREHYPDLDLESLPGIEFRVCSGSEIPQEDVAHMRTMYEANYAHHSAEFRAVLMEGFERKLQDARFYLARVKGRVVAFDTFTDKGDNEVYFGAFNSAPHMHGLLMGGAVLDRSLQCESERKTVVADCFPDEDISKKYINTLVFVGVGETCMGGEKLLHIVRSVKSNTEEPVSVSLETVKNGVLPEGLYVHTSTLEQPFAFTPDHSGDVLVRLWNDGEHRYEVYRQTKEVDIPVAE